MDEFKAWLIAGADPIKWSDYFGEPLIAALVRWKFTAGEFAVLQKIVLPYCKEAVENFGDPFDLYAKSLFKRIETAQKRGWKGE